MRRRHRVVLRAKVRRERSRQFAAFAAVLMLGAAAVATVRHLGAQLPSWGELRAKIVPPPSTIEIGGVPAALQTQILAHLASKPRGLTTGELIAEIKERFSCVEDVTVRRPWRSEMARFELKLKRAFARVVRSGLPAGYMAEDGRIFVAPPSLYPEDLAEIDPGSAGQEQLEKAAAVLAAGQALPSPVRALRQAPQGGWQALLADGLAVYWGDLRWTKQKIERLSEVLESARLEFGEITSVDMRYFEDGRILVRPSRLRERAHG
ncbi:MAG: cell division protein FtsQ [Elusimicrobia bacterium]|nr:cell division protein FtsQ [Elusimicrobiota bacterium]